VTNALDSLPAGTKIEYFLYRPPEWISGTGPESDIVISTRIRLARNLKGIAFSRKAGVPQRRSVLEAAAAAAPATADLAGAFLIELEKVSETDRRFLVERHLISPELSARQQGAVIVGARESVSVMINEEDHLRLQVLQSGFRLTETLAQADRLDNDLEKQVAYEFSPVLGYLTACPTNVGTGLRASAMLHLPGLVIRKQIGQIIQAFGKLGLAVRGIYGEGTQASGNMFQISNQVTLGKTDSEIVRDLGAIIRKVAAYERAARSFLAESRAAELEDRIFRSAAVLRSARLISSEETLDLLSGLCLGVDMGFLPEIPRAAVNELFLSSQPAHLQKFAGKELSSRARDELRASLLREKLGGDQRRAPERKK
jgi:protein arginine kinase